MEALVAAAIAVLIATGTYLLLRRHTFDAILGLSLIAYGVNLFVFAAGGLRVDAAPVVARGNVDVAVYADPLPQALVLTAIVIGFAMTAFLVILAIRGYLVHGSDNLDAGADQP